MADYQDLYIERFAPGDPARYEYRGEWLPAERRRETIRVRGAESVEIDMTVTHHGPVVLGDPGKGYALAVRYSATATRTGASPPSCRCCGRGRWTNSTRRWVPGSIRPTIS